MEKILIYPKNVEIIDIIENSELSIEQKKFARKNYRRLLYIVDVVTQEHYCSGKSLKLEYSQLEWLLGGSKTRNWMPMLVTAGILNKEKIFKNNYYSLAEPYIYQMPWTEFLHDKLLENKIYPNQNLAVLFDYNLLVERLKNDFSIEHTPEEEEYEYQIEYLMQFIDDCSSINFIDVGKIHNWYIYLYTIRNLITGNFKYFENMPDLNNCIM